MAVSREVAVLHREPYTCPSGQDLLLLRNGCLLKRLQQPLNYLQKCVQLGRKEGKQEDGWEECQLGLQALTLPQQNQRAPA